MNGTPLKGTRKLVGAVAAMLSILGAMALHGFFDLPAAITAPAIATIGALGGAQVVGQAWVDRHNGGATDVPSFDGVDRSRRA